MTVVYLDSFLLLNFVVNYLLLAASGKLSGEALFRGRYALAAAFGTGYAAATLLPQTSFLSHPVCKAGAAVWMLLIAFGKSKRLLRNSALFLTLSCAFGGGMLLLETVERGAPASVGMRSILISAALCYGILSLLLGGEFSHTRTAGEIEELTLFRNGKSVTLLALRDSGNTLHDPLTGYPVLVVEGEKVRPLLPEFPELNRTALEHPVETMGKLGGRQSGLSLRLLPYRAVGVDCGMLLAVRLDKAESKRGAYRNCLTALSPTPLSDGGGYCALIGSGEF